MGAAKKQCLLSAAKMAPLKIVSLSEMMFFISFGIPITYEKHCMKRLFFYAAFLLCAVLVFAADDDIEDTSQPLFFVR